MMLLTLNLNILSIYYTYFLHFIAVLIFMIQPKEKKNPYLSNCISLFEELFFFNSAQRSFGDFVLLHI